mgnify:CR=1 FL=1
MRPAAHHLYPHTRVHHVASRLTRSRDVTISPAIVVPTGATGVVSSSQVLEQLTTICFQESVQVVVGMDFNKFLILIFLKKLIFSILKPFCCIMIGGV